MKSVKLGIKLWSSNKNLLNEAVSLVERGIFDYVELKVVPGTECKYFDKARIPYIIHASSGINIADKNMEENNVEMIDLCLKWKKQLNAMYLVLHPDYGSLNVAVKTLNRFCGEDILVENMPKIGINNEKMIGFNVEQMKKLLRNEFGFCLDINHAIKAAISCKKEYKVFIEDMLELKPILCHFSDGSLKGEKDEHLDIGKGEYDIKLLCGYIKRSSIEYLTMETPKSGDGSLEKDLDNVKKLRAIINLIRR